MPASLRLMNPATSSEWSEADIKRYAASNPRAAMEMVIQKYREPLYFHARYIVKDHQEAYDVVEVFIKAMREQRLFNDEFKIKAWLFRVTSTCALTKSVTASGAAPA